MIRFFLYSILSTSLLFATGCAHRDLGGNTYSRGDARQSMDVRHGNVVSVRSVKLEGRHNLGGLVGAVAGGIVGSGLGGGNGTRLATLGGAVAGGVIGSKVEQNINESNGLEIIVKMDGGRKIAVIQERDEMQLTPGDRVNLIGSGNNIRVTR